MRLRDVAMADRLDELSFELPLVGGDTPTGTLALSDLASLLETHLPADDPLIGYADRLRDPLVRWDLRGYQRQRRLRNRPVAVQNRFPPCSASTP